MDPSQLQRFTLEAQKRDGTEYLPTPFHHLCCGIMRYLRWNGWPAVDFFVDPGFTDFRATLDGEMKRLQSQSLGAKKKQAEPLTEHEEEIIWNKGLLRDATPQTLLNTMVFMSGHILLCAVAVNTVL